MRARDVREEEAGVPQQLEVVDRDAAGAVVGRLALNEPRDE